MASSRPACHVKHVMTLSVTVTEFAQLLHGQAFVAMTGDHCRRALHGLLFNALYAAAVFPPRHACRRGISVKQGMPGCHHGTTLGMLMCSLRCKHQITIRCNCQTTNCKLRRQQNFSTPGQPSDILQGCADTKSSSLASRCGWQS